MVLTFGPRLFRCRPPQSLTWGLRDLKKVGLLNVTRPRVLFECGGVVKVRAYMPPPHR